MTEIFQNRPQKYPQAQQKAMEVVSSMHGLMKKGPRTLVGTVVGTDFHTTMGYVLATTELGLVRVSGVPVGTVVPQMRIFVRQTGPHGSHHSFIFDGYAPALSALGFASGSVIYTTPVGDSGSLLGSTSSGAMPAVSTITSSIGYYWHCFFYLPSLPTSSRVTLFTMRNTGGTNGFSIEYLSSGLLVVRDPIGGHGYITTAPVAPHTIHWLFCQPGLGSSQDLLIDGLSFYTGIQSTGDVPVFSGGSNTYTGYLLSNPDGSATPPLGTWISKLGYGASLASGVAVALSAGLTIPTEDDEIPNFNLSTTQKTLGLYLCLDTVPTPPTATTLANSSTGSAGSFTLTSNAVLSPTGPY